MCVRECVREYLHLDAIVVVSSSLRGTAHTCPPLPVPLKPPLQIPRPDSVDQGLGLLVLDEPCAAQSGEAPLLVCLKRTERNSRGCVCA